jgi:exonuclease SbcC
MTEDELVTLLDIPSDEAAALAGRVRTVEHELLTARGESDARDRDLETALAAEPPRPLADLIADIEAHETQMNALRERKGSLEETLRRDNEAREHDATLATELDSAKRQRKVWSEVHAAIGQADGSKFQRFAQRITLAHLVHLANQQLALLAPRYALERTPGESLGLQVMDRDMGDERRATTSLSGGETFLVSLALALALSSLEGRQGFVDTLFIDEGFGALDSTTVDIAIDALERLPSIGRRVCVISHVEAMNQRIPIQIRVERRGGGTSRLRIDNAEAAA